MNVCILDPGLLTQDGRPSNNLGDLIIQEAVHREAVRLFPNAEIVSYSTHSPLTKAQKRSLRGMDWILVGGTNLLTSRFRPWNRWVASLRCWSNQWSIDLLDALAIRRAVLLGVGWTRYQQAPDVFSRVMYRIVLSRSAYHSVRTEYARRKLAASGVPNVLNTGCASMWGLAEARPAPVPASQGADALLMLTDYAKDPALDLRLLEMVSDRYKKVYAWPQGSEDAPYLKELGFAGVLLDRTLPALDAFIRSHASLDYIGTRLHGGIRCLQNRRRALIVEVDNRAREIGRDTGLPTVRRDDFAAMAEWIGGAPPPDICLPQAAIEQWRRQFQAAPGAVRR